MKIKFTRQQDLAMTMIGEWFRTSTRRPFMLNGYAGTGKTTIAKFVSEVVGCKEKQVIYIAPTGKAASVLLKKECEGATTIHKLLYRPLPKMNDKIRELERTLLVAKTEKEREKILLLIAKEKKKNSKQKSPQENHKHTQPYAYAQ